MKWFLALVVAGACSAQPAEVRRWGDYWADEYGVERELVHAVIEFESRGNPRAISSAGAAGVMQLMPDTAVAFRVRNRFDVEDNVRAGVAYLAWLRDLCRGDRRLMMASYVTGQNRVLRLGIAFTYSSDVHDYVARIAYLYRRNRWETLLREGVENKMKRFVFLAGTVLAAAQTPIKPIVSQRTVNEQVNIVRLSPRYSTAIKLPEAVSSVVVGDPIKFLAEHSDKEPTLVLVKPVSEDAAESNLLVTTVKGTHLSLLLRSDGPSARAPVDFVVSYRSAGSFLVEDSAVGTGEVAGTTELAPNRPAAALSQAPSSLLRAARVRTDGAIEFSERDGLSMLLERQQRATLPQLYGMRTATPAAKGDLVKVGISEVVDQGGEVVVLFSIVNPQAHAIEILPPQIQLAGKFKRGFPVKRSHWGTSQQFPVRDFRLARRRIGSGERTDGVVLFARPSFKQSNETLFLQIAESGAVDKPALAPIGFGVSAVRKEANRGK